MARALRLGLLVCVAAGVFAVAAPMASAASIHVFSSDIGSAGAGAGQLSSPQDVAVNDATGNVYVADTGNHRVDEFSSSGTFIQAWGWGVADGASSFETCTSTCQAGTSGSSPGEFETAAFIAVDNSSGPSAGDVYLGDTGDDLITKFTATGGLVSTWGTNGQLNGSASSNGPFASIGGETVDPSGNLWVLDGNRSRWFEFGEEGTLVTSFTDPRGTNNVGIGIDSNGNLYKVVGAGNVEQLSSTGADIGDLSDGPGGGNVLGFAIDSATNDVYADDAGGTEIEHYVGSSLSTCVSARGCTPTETFGSGHLTTGAGVGFNATTGAVYVADKGANDIAVFGAVTVPDVVTQSATNETGTTATLNGTVNPGGTTITACHFDYGLTTSYGQTAACVPASPSGSSPVAVTAAVTGLTVGTTYHFRLEASNSNGTADGSDATFSTTSRPSVDSASAANITANSADMNAEINPGGADTTYHVEWGTSTSYGRAVPVPDADIGSGTSDVSVSQHITGLTENTEYHWRVVATNANGTTTSPDHTFNFLVSTGGPDTCPNAQFRTGLSALLPDCRAYEQVTPPYKGGYTFSVLTVASSDGSRLVGASLGSFSGEPAAPGLGGSYQFTRGATGWLTTPLDPPASEFPGAPQFPNLGGYAYDVGSGDTALLGVRRQSQPEDAESLYIRQADGSLVQVGPEAPASALIGQTGLTSANQNSYFTYAGASDDLSHVLFTIFAPSPCSPNSYLWPGDATEDPGCVGNTSLYEYVGTGNSAPSLVGVSGGLGSTTLISQCGTDVGAGSDQPHEAYNAVSGTGATVFFTATGADDVNCGGTEPAVDELFARLNDSQTVAISEPSVADCSACDTATADQADALFQGASRDGSKVFFLTTQPLLGGDSTNNLYEYDFNAPAGQKLIRVSAGDPSGAKVVGVARVSEDGSHVYFVAQGVLTSKPNGVGDSAQPGGDNLYVYDTTSAQTAFVATLSSKDSTDWDPGDFDRPVEATPDGRFLLFSSSAQLTPDDTSTSQQLFRYDAQTGALVRISIGEDGFNDSGNTDSFDATIPTNPFGFQSAAIPSTVAMSDDGAYVFFQSADGLTPRALNGDQVAGTTSNPVFAQNVYEYHDGQVSLISDGQDVSSGGVRLVGTDATGTNVFFTTFDPLVPQDTDTSQDLYDARVDGGFPAPAQPAQCSGEACQGALSPPPSAPTAASITFSGPGNAAPRTASARVRLLNTVVHGPTFSLQVKVPGKGRITVTGAGIKTVRRSVTKAGTYKLKVTLSAKEKRALKHKHTLKLRLAARYTPVSGRPSAATSSITDKASVTR